MRKGERGNEKGRGEDRRGEERRKSGGERRGERKESLLKKPSAFNP